MTTVCDAQALEDRVARLERQNRRLWAAVLLACLVVALSLDAGAGAAPVTPTALEATHFILKAADGSKRGEWLVDEEGNGRFMLRGPDGQIIGEMPFRKQRVPLAR